MSKITEMAREMGRRGAAGRLAKLTPEQRREISRLGAYARWRKASTLALGSSVTEAGDSEPMPAGMPGWGALQPVRGDIADYIDRVWTPKLVRTWEATLDAALKSGDIDAITRVTAAMTAMTPRLTPARMRQFADGAFGGLPSDVDLSHLTDEDLARMTRRKLPSNDG